MCRPQRRCDLEHCRQRHVKSFLQRSVAHRTTSFVQAEYEKILESSPFLCQEIGDHDRMPTLHRSQVQTGALIAQGAFSEVRVVERVDEEDLFHEHLDGTNQERNPLVIKHLRSDLVHGGRRKFYQAASDLLVEAAFLSRLDHPHIINLRAMSSDGAMAFANGQSDGFFLVLDRVECTLSGRLEEWRAKEEHSPVPLSHRLGVALQIADALSYLHRHRIIFRDLKPDNVGMIGSTVKLLDFGLCRELPQVVGDDQIMSDTDPVFHMSGVGTRRYLAPEVGMGEPYNLKADVYSFAVVLYEILTLTKPFELFTSEMHTRLVFCEQERPSVSQYLNWPADLRQLVESGWSHSIDERPSIHDILERIKRMSTVQRRSERFGFFTIKADAKHTLSSFSRNILKRMRTGDFAFSTLSTEISSSSRDSFCET